MIIPDKIEDLFNNLFVQANAIEQFLKEVVNLVNKLPEVGVSQQLKGEVGVSRVCDQSRNSRKHVHDEVTFQISLRNIFELKLPLYILLESSYKVEENIESEGDVEKELEEHRLVEEDLVSAGICHAFARA